MNALRGLALTTAGRYLCAKLAATSQPLIITRVLFGTGKMPDGSTNNDLLSRTELIEPFAEGSCTTPIYENDTVSAILQFRSDMNGGLQETVWLNEYGVYANDDGNDILFLYGNLGDFPDSVLAYKDGILTVRDYPISVVIGAAADVKINFPASAYLTSQDADDLLNACMRRAVGLQEISFSIQPQDWKNTNNGRYLYTAIVSLPDVKESHLPDVFFDAAGRETAYSSGVSQQVETLDGKLCFSSQVAPDTAMNGICRLWTPGIGGGAAELPDGAFATDKEVTDALQDVYGR